MKPFRWGIFGTGAISAKFVAGLATSQGSVATFVASRSLEKAERFAAGMGIGRAIEGYEAAAAAGDVDAIYIATPPSEHANHALLCIKAGVPVLVEKPFAMNAEEAHVVAQAARTASVFAMEAMWTRFLPAAHALKQAIDAQSVGPARFVTGSFGTSQTPEPANGMFNPALGGGALAHLGPYPLSLAQWLFGKPTLIAADGSFGASGVDESVAIQLRYPGNVMGSFLLSLRAWAPDDFKVLGERGMVAVRGSVVRPTGLDISHEEPLQVSEQTFGWKSKLRQHDAVHRLAQITGRAGRSRAERTDHRYRGNGYHYEVDEVRACVEAGSLESTTMSLGDSIDTLTTMDEIRAAIRTDNPTKVQLP